MATATAVSIGTGNKVSVDYQSQEVTISVTWELERSDTDLMAFVIEKSAEVEKAHSTVWRRIREIRAEQKAQEAAGNTPGASSGASAEAAPPGAPGVPAPERAPATTVRRGRNGRGQSPAPVRVEASPEETPASRNGDTPSAEVESDPFADDPTPSATPAQEAPPAPPSEEMSSFAQQRAILSLAGRARMSDQALVDLLTGRFAKRTVEQLTKREAAQLLVELQRRDRVPAAQAA